MTYRSRLALPFALFLVPAVAGCDSEEPSDTMGDNTELPDEDEPMDDEPMDDGDNDEPGDDEPEQPRGE